eukprot:Awhi_evm1s152
MSAKPQTKEVDSQKKEDVINLIKVRSSIPKQCWEISTFKSSLYLLQDIVLIAGLYLFRYYWLDTFMATILLEQKMYGIAIAFGLRFLWWNILGFQLWCLFMIGHDCGHGTFSTSPVVNMIVGHIAHTPLLVPFHGWRSSHRIHHMYHQDLDRDKTWTPISESKAKEWQESTPGQVYAKVRFSWLSLFLFPYYLLKFQSNDVVYGSHFNPFNKTIFQSTHDRVFAIIGTSSIILFIAGVFKASFLLNPEYSTSSVLLFSVDYYFVPYIIFSMWLSFITNLHHTRPDSLYFRNSQWSFVKGAASTVDRDFGTIINYLMHNIETHFVHHLFFTKIPHYHLVEATEHAKTVLGKLYKKDFRNPFMAFLEDIPYCKTVDDTGDVLHFQQYEQFLTDEQEKKKLN